MQPDTNNKIRLKKESRKRITKAGRSECRQREAVRVYGTSTVDVIGDAHPRNVNRKMTVPNYCMYIVRISVNSNKKDVKVKMF